MATETYELLGGQYEDERGVKHESRDPKTKFVKSDKPLDKMFVNSFRKVKKVEADDDEAPKVATRPPLPAETQEEKDNTDNKHADFGNDVSDQFAHAEDAKAKVFKKKNAFTVVAEDDENAPLHKDPIRIKNDVTKLLKKRAKDLAAEDDEDKEETEEGK